MIGLLEAEDQNARLVPRSLFHRKTEVSLSGCFAYGFTIYLYQTFKIFLLICTIIVMISEQRHCNAERLSRQLLTAKLNIKTSCLGQFLLF